MALADHGSNPGPGGARPPSTRRSRHDARRSTPARDGRRLGLAGAAGTLAALSSIGLLATSAWLISRSAQHPPVLYLMVPVAAVQAFGIGRSFFRYAERLAGHDAALRILARMRMSAYDRLERLAPAGTAAFRSGDLISRLVSDIDSLTDRWLRLRLPYAVALTTGSVTVAVMATLQPASGLVLAVSLAAAALAAPLLASVIGYQAERRLSPLRGELAAATADLLNGAGELVRVQQQRGRAAGRDRRRRGDRPGTGEVRATPVGSARR